MIDALQNTWHNGSWTQGDSPPQTDAEGLQNALYSLSRPFVLVDWNGQPAAAKGGSLTIELSGNRKDFGAPRDSAVSGVRYPVLAFTPSLPPENMGDPEFKKRYNLRYAYVGGAMANGITSTAMVEAMGKAGMMGFYGAAGLTLAEVEKAIDEVQRKLGDSPYGFNLIHSPGDLDLEDALTGLYIKQGIRKVCASAYLNLTPALVRYRVSGIYQDGRGNIVCPNQVVAKVSREEVAQRFFSPPPEKFLMQLLEEKTLTREQVDLARHIPMADSLTAEADSGGHTDNRPAISLLPTLIALRNEMVKTHLYPQSIPVGLGGGIGTPQAAAAAFSMGAAYILTGSVNQACVEAGTSEAVRRLLAEARQADVAMAPAADMFEMGVKVQVLKRGTMFAQRAAKLYELYTSHDRLEDIPEKHRIQLERDVFKCSLDDEWQQTKAFFLQRDPRQVDRAEQDPRHKMALVFRSYLGQSSRWATTGRPDRKMDYQIWCGPTMGAFNAWVLGSFLEKPENRDTITIAMNLLFGACILTRANWMRCQGVALPPNMDAYSPLPLNAIVKYMQ
ncbi:MAG: PfaD family polyunsaturated fatty acid/polyketide biosynthesis protein [Deltaproteobacteria bacterium]|nr:PfaD family polyunsaturated fatty acid/polyketide biosynthesis protein [Deltaproteobacteria bacterium]